MAEQPFHYPAFPNPVVGEANVAYPEQTLWQHMQSAKSLPELTGSWLMLQCRMISGVNKAVVALGKPDQGPFSASAHYPVPHDPMEFQKVIERCLRERKGVVIKKEENDSPAPGQFHYHLAYPIVILGQLHGAVAMEITNRPQPQLQSAMRQLQWGMAWLEKSALLQKTQEAATASSAIATAMDMTAITLQDGRYRAAATAFATELATRLNCDRVSIGFLRRGKNKVDILSHSAQFAGQMNLLRAIGEAMDECTDQQVTLAHPDSEEKSQRILYAHKQLARQQGNGAILTVPFVDKDGKAYGAMMLERSQNQPFDNKAVLLCESLASLAGPILQEKRLNDQWLIVKMAQSLRRPFELVLGPGHLVMKLATLLVIALAVYLSVATGDFRITAHSTIEGEIQRALVAPYNGFIYETKARAGDVLKAGDPICRLDDRDMKLERLAWLSQKEQYERQLRQAMAENDRPRTKVLAEQINQADAQVRLLDEQISRAAISAPFDGVVVSGDLTQNLGAPVEKGEVLFQMAPLDSYRVILQVEEADVNDIRTGQQGNLLLTSLPHKPLPVEVTKITPVSMSKDGKAYFEVEARLLEKADELRPGMEGIGKVMIDRRKRIWIWTHDLVNWARLKAWSWIP